MLPVQRSAVRVALLGGVLAIGLPLAAAADCPGRDDAIGTDRPSVTNSGTVVPFGSVQLENGLNWTARQSVNTLDGSETRVRIGAFPCAELIVDVPNYIRSFDVGSSSAFSETVVSVKRQLFVQSKSFSMSVTGGIGLPGLGTSAANRGYTPYIQSPWSRSIAGPWSVNGMFTMTWSTVADTTFESTFGVGREAGRRGAVFVEYVGDYTRGGSASQIVDGGGGWHLTPKQQVDVHVGGGLTSASPRYYVGIGYSVRLDVTRADARGSAPARAPENNSSRRRSVPSRRGGGRRQESPSAASRA